MTEICLNFAWKGTTGKGTTGDTEKAGCLHTCLTKKAPTQLRNPTRICLFPEMKAAFVVVAFLEFPIKEKQPVLGLFLTSRGYFNK